jgi:hypothetical protein
MLAWSIQLTRREIRKAIRGDVVDFIVEKKSFDSAMRQLLQGRKENPDDLVEIAAEDSIVTLAATGTEAQAQAQCEAGGRVRISVADLAKLRKISSTYKAGPVRVRIGEGRIRFQNTSFSPITFETGNAHKLIDIPADSGLMDLVALPAIYSEEEIADSGLREKVAVAKKQVHNLVTGTASDLSNFGISTQEVNQMVQERINERVELNRRILRPVADPSHGAPGQRPNSKSSANGEMTMNEDQMRAELERLRAENAQLKNKKRDGLSLKVSDKGAVSLYGMGRFPVTLYKEQWLRILAAAPEIEKFIQENDSKLKTKE